ncbi:DUF2306 domain-containing protein [Thalassotalea euphylliae]|uniref:DUF2306 domain-containing protein n=1 Tax=Thalassotalea euphylliae TaxID=1655234 RepID=A0A3E0TR33_9GAMM|nr:DUF2306 domain-containing protein [Thalassotalea euphylliae]REL26405.1 DUF2306 domain-containing protein [Thalassotalea euphylliae]
MLRHFAWPVMTVLAFGVAVYALLNLSIPTFRSQFIANLFDTSPEAISLHLAGGIGAMIFGALQLNRQLRVKYIGVHRWLGRLYVLAVVLGGLSGLVLALNAFGGMASQFGFGLMALCWLGTTLTAYWHILHGDVTAHRDWMIRSYALTLAGVTLRVYLGLSTLVGIKFSDFYPVLSWICWVPNLLLVEWFVLTQLYKTSKG